MAEELKATHPDLKILFTSGYTDDALDAWAERVRSWLVDIGDHVKAGTAVAQLDGRSIARELVESHDVTLLERNPDPTETEIRYWLAGNLCRCTGYDKIVRAVMETAAEMQEAAQ